MKFILTYDGELQSNGRKRDKWEIRKSIQPQLKELWEITPGLRRLKTTSLRYLHTASGYIQLEAHHSLDAERDPHIKPPPEPRMDILESIPQGNRQFFPLIRDSLGLKCGLRITFLRKEDGGRVYQGGDMDNRLKTFLDALSMPTKEQVLEDPTTDDPIYCLMQDDALITRLEVDTQRLLSRPNASQHEVRLIVEVDVRVTHPRTYNQCFLGD